jgi:hypothetical protein
VGYQRTVYRVITDKTIDFVVDDLKALGYPHGSFRYLDPQVDGFFDLSGSELEFMCEIENYQGEDKERWSIARQATELQVDPLESSKLRQLDALFGKQMKVLDKNGSSKPAEEPAGATASSEQPPDFSEANQAITDDDVPF